MKLRSLISFMGCLHLMAAYAQDSTHQAKSDLPVVSVIRSYAYEHIGDLSSSGPRYVIDQRRIRSLGQTDVGSAIKYLPGIQLRDYGGVGGIRTVSFRSLGSTHTAVFLDQVQQPNTQTGTINLSTFEVFGVNEIEFCAGQPQHPFATASAYLPASRLSIRSEINQPDSSLNIRLYQNVSTVNAFETGLILQSNIGENGFIGAQGFGKYGTGQYDYTYALSGSNEVQQRDNSDILQLKGRIAGGYKWKNAQLKASLAIHDNRQQLPGAVILFNPSNDQQLENQDLKADVRFFQQLENWTWNTHAFISSNFTHYHDPTFLNTDGFISSRYYQDIAGGGVLFNRQANEDLRLFFGADAVGAKLLSNEFDNHPSRNRLNSVVGFHYWLGVWKFEGNISHQLLQDIARSSDTLLDHAYSKFSPYLAIAVSPIKNLPNLRLRSSFKRAFRMPTFNDLYYNFIGNTKLKPEDAYVSNVGITFTDKHSSKSRSFRNTFEVSLDGFFNRVKNKIVAVPSKDLFNWSMQNIGVTRSWGADLAINFSQQIDHWQWMTAVNLTYNRSMDVSDVNSPSYRHQIPYTPKLSGTSTLMGGYKGWLLSTNLVYTGKRYSLNENINSNLMDPFLDWNVGIEKSFDLPRHQKLFLNARVMNILNKNYEVIRSFPMPGRYYQFILRYSFR